MKTHFLLCTALALTIAGCDQKNSAVDDLQRKNADLQSRLEEQERAAKLKAAEDLAVQQVAANDEAARKLAADRAALDAQMARLTAAQRAAEAERFQLKQEALKAEEQRIADARAMSARQAAEARERARTREVRPVAEKRTLDLFYDQLDPYGDWIEVEGYGFVFQPAIAANRSWRPYVDGAWLRTDQGWVWKSNEPFGWATYHYGRWMRLNKRGWAWVPGSEWAPAWVAWRWNEDYVGWAPLPPEAYSANGFNSAVDEYYDIGAGTYVFVSLRNFSGGNSYAGRLVDGERNARIVHETANVTNISYRQVNQQTVIVNEGPSFAVVSAAAPAPVPTLRIQRNEIGNPHEQPQISAAGVLSIFAPALIHQMQSKPKVVKSQETHDVNRGWKDVPADMQARIRERNANEARQFEGRQRAGVPAAQPTPPPRAAAPVSQPAPPAPASPNSPGGLRSEPPGRPVLPAPTPPPASPAISTPPVVAPAPQPAPIVKPGRKPAPVTPVPAPTPIVRSAPVVAPEPKPPAVPPTPTPAPVIKLEPKPVVIPPTPTPAPVVPPAPVIKLEPKPVVVPPTPTPAPVVPPAPVIKLAPKPVIVPPTPMPAPVVPPAPVIKLERKPVVVPPTPTPTPVVPPAPIIKREPNPAVVPPVPAPAAPAPPPAPDVPKKPDAP